MIIMIKGGVSERVKLRKEANKERGGGLVNRSQPNLTLAILAE